MGFEQFVKEAIRDRTCSCCSNAIEPKEKHFGFDYSNNFNHLQKLKICRYCLRKILELIEGE